MAKKLPLLRVAVLASLGLASCSLQASADLFAVRENLTGEHDEALVSIDTDTFEPTVIGFLNVPVELGGLAYDANSDTLYMHAGNVQFGNLYTLNQLTGAPTFKGANGIISLYGLAFDTTNDVLYATVDDTGPGTSPELLTLNTMTGEATMVGSTNPAAMDGLAYDSQRDMLVGIAAAGLSKGNLHSIDRSTGAPTLLFDGPDVHRSGLAYDSNKDVYWDLDVDGVLSSFDPNNGFARTDHTTLGGFRWAGGLAFKPTFLCDFDDDGLCNIGDLNEMLAEGPLAPGVPVSPQNDQFDLNDDGTLNFADVNEWLAEAGSVNGFDSPYKQGDADLDGVVDGIDFIFWNARRFSSSLRWDYGNFNADGVVDGVDFILWNENKFTSSDVAQVPEPSAWVLLVLALAIHPFARRD